MQVLVWILYLIIRNATNTANVYYFFRLNGQQNYWYLWEYNANHFVHIANWHIEIFASHVLFCGSLPKKLITDWSTFIYLAIVLMEINIIWKEAGRIGRNKSSNVTLGDAGGRGIESPANSLHSHWPHPEQLLTLSCNST